MTQNEIAYVGKIAQTFFIIKGMSKQNKDPIKDALLTCYFKHPSLHIWNDS